MEPFHRSPSTVAALLPLLSVKFAAVVSRYRAEWASGGRGCPGVFLLEPRSLTYPTAACEGSSLCQRHAPLSTLPLSFFFPSFPAVLPPAFLERSSDSSFASARRFSNGKTRHSFVFRLLWRPVAYPRKCSNYSRNSRNFAMDDEECSR